MKVLKPHSEPTSPSMSRTSSPPPSDEDDEPDSEEERAELSKAETPTGSSGRQTPVSLN